VGRNWKATLVALGLIIPIGFYSKFYRGPAFLSLVLPRVGSWKLASGVLSATCALEFLQLWHPPFLEAARSTFLGAVLLGTTFDWTDFPYYFVGSGMGYLWLRLLII